VPAPINKGDQIGKIVVIAPDAERVERPLFAAASVKQIGMIGRMATLAGYLIWGSRH
jgi:D-alanyl-D-alanine carboxypeptidase (penicillin-binding protein 5/6)